MLHDILLSLLGFTGDVIVCDGSTFKVKPGFDKLSESEQVLFFIVLYWNSSILPPPFVFISPHTLLSV